MIKMKTQELILTLLSSLLLCMNGFAGDISPLAEQWFFSERISDDWYNSIPSDAKPFTLKNRKLDLDTLRNGVTGKEHDTAVVYNRFQSDCDGVLSLGFSCDWWMQVFCNGKEYLNTMESGNGSIFYDPLNIPVKIPVKKGTNLIAVKVKRGLYTFTFACGSVPSDLIDLKIPRILAPQTLPPPAKNTNNGSSYQLIVFGDTHFDASDEIYYKAGNESNAHLDKKQQEEFIRKELIWRKREPRKLMLKAAADQITDKTRAVIQLGDLIDGNYDNAKTHERVIRDTLATFKASFNPLPFLTVAGNHDVLGYGAPDTYRKTMFPYLSKELNQKITSTTFYFMLENDLYLFIDFNSPDCDVICKAFAEHSDARYKFVITHGPVIPSDSLENFWFLFGGVADNARIYFRELFLRNDVIVLTGHEHVLELLECMTNSGRITQLMVNSVWSTKSLAEFVQECDSPAEYGRKQKDIFRNPDGMQLVAEYQPAITRYWHAKGAGFFRLDVSPDGVVANYFGGDSTTPSKIIRLR